MYFKYPKTEKEIRIWFWIYYLCICHVQCYNEKLLKKLHTHCPISVSLTQWSSCIISGMWVILRSCLLLLSQYPSCLIRWSSKYPFVKRCFGKACRSYLSNLSFESVNFDPVIIIQFNFWVCNIPDLLPHKIATSNLLKPALIDNYNNFHSSHSGQLATCMLVPLILLSYN